MRTRNHRPGGFTLVEIMIVVAMIGLLAAIAIPNFVRARNTSRKNSCLNNLKQIDSAKHQWALEFKKTDTDTPTSDDLKPYIRNSQFPSCPAVGTYTIGAMNTDPTCPNAASLNHVLPPP